MLFIVFSTSPTPHTCPIQPTPARLLNLLQREKKKEKRGREREKELKYGRKNVKLLLALLICYLWVGFGGIQEKTPFQIQKWIIPNKLQ